MLTQNGQNFCLTGNYPQNINDSKNLNPLTVEDEEFVRYLKFHGVDNFIKSLKMIHDFALYHTDLCFDIQEKSALFDLKILWEGLESLEKS